MSETQDDSQPRWLAPPIQIAATALAGITAAFVGSMLGVYGTVLGAGLASGITTVGASLYERSLQRTKDKVREGAHRVPIDKVRRQAAAATRTRVIAPVDNSRTNQADPPTRKLHPVGGAAVTTAGTGPGTNRRVKWLLVAGTAVAGFLIAMLAVTGFETVKGQALSGGHGTSVSSFFQRQPAQGNTPVPQPEPQRQQPDEQPPAEQQQSPQQDQQDGVPQRNQPSQQQQPQGDPQQPTEGGQDPDSQHEDEPQQDENQTQQDDDTEEPDQQDDTPQQEPQQRQQDPGRPQTD